MIRRKHERIMPREKLQLRNQSKKAATFKSKRERAPPRSSPRFKTTITNNLFTQMQLPHSVSETTQKSLANNFCITKKTWVSARYRETSEVASAKKQWEPRSTAGKLTFSHGLLGTAVARRHKWMCNCAWRAGGKESRGARASCLHASLSARALTWEASPFLPLFLSLPGVCTFCSLREEHLPLPATSTTGDAGCALGGCCCCCCRPVPCSLNKISTSTCRQDFRSTAIISLAFLCPWLGRAAAAF
jgi:hypothetical protein